MREPKKIHCVFSLFVFGSSVCLFFCFGTELDWFLRIFVSLRMVFMQIRTDRICKWSCSASGMCIHRVCIPSIWFVSSFRWFSIEHQAVRRSDRYVAMRVRRVHSELIFTYMFDVFGVWSAMRNFVRYMRFRSQSLSICSIQIGFCRVAVIVPVHALALPLTLVVLISSPAKANASDILPTISLSRLVIALHRRNRLRFAQIIYLCVYHWIDSNTH